MIEELAPHGYKISPGSLYPFLQGLERKGYLKSTELRNRKSLRRVYRATPAGRKALSGPGGPPQHCSEGVTQCELQITLAGLGGDFPERAAGRIGVGAAPIGVIDPVEGLRLELDRL